ncbi:hypothetical protein WJX79_003988 [Trebouxia sp. C0005]
MVYVSSGNGGTSLIGSQQAYAISQVQPQLEPVSLDFGAGGLTAITPQSLQSVQTALERIEQGPIVFWSPAKHVSTVTSSQRSDGQLHGVPVPITSD